MAKQPALPKNNMDPGPNAGTDPSGINPSNPPDIYKIIANTTGIPLNQFMQHAFNVPNPSTAPGTAALANPSPPKDTGGKKTDPSATLPDVFSEGFQLFAQQYLAPLMQQTNAVNNSLINNTGQALSQAIASSNLPPQMQGMFKAQDLQTQQLLQMLNNAQFSATADLPQFNDLMTNLQQYTAATKALSDVYQQAATSQLLTQGGGQQLQGALAKETPGSLGALLSSLLGTTGGLLPGVGTAAAGGTANAAANTAAGTTGAAAVPANTGLAPLTSQILAGQLGNAGGANAAAGAGYTPPPSGG